MSLQLVRGREEKPPSRTARANKPTVAHLQTATLQAKAAAPERKTALRFPVGASARAFYRHF